MRMRNFHDELSLRRSEPATMTLVISLIQGGPTRCHALLTSFHYASRIIRIRTHVCDISVRDIPRIAFSCCTAVQPRIATVRFTAGNGSESRNKAHWFLYDPARYFITVRTAAGMVINVCDMGRKKSVSFVFFPPFFHGYTIRLFCSCAETSGRALFFSNNGTIFGAAEMEIYLITDTRARRPRYTRLRRFGHAVCFVLCGLRVDGILSISPGKRFRTVHCIQYTV